VSMQMYVQEISPKRLSILAFGVVLGSFRHRALSHQRISIHTEHHQLIGAHMHTSLRPFLTQSIFALGSLAVGLPAIAAEAGWRHLDLTTASAQPAIPVALYYPTAAPTKTVNMGPFQLNVSIQAPPAQQFKALIVLSHGLWGTELAHSSLAESLARSGYLVAALRHPGDNWQDHSLTEKTPSQYFIARPRALTQVIDGILALPEWAVRLPRDEKGYLVGALGHSAGGFSVLALAGGRADPRRMSEHCKANAAQDPILCGIGAASENNASPSGQITSASTPPGGETGAMATPATDPRIRAVVAMAPTGVPLTPESLAAIKIPVLIYVAEMDRFLVPKFHGERVAKDLPTSELRRISNAWHFAFMDAPTSFIHSPDGDVRADPPGFDRPGLLKRLAEEIPAFFDKAFK
jgi:predicted dienelactone hydrolase